MTTQSTTADALDVVMHAVLKSMSETNDHETEEFKALTERLASLYKMKEIELNAEIKREENKLQDDKFANDVANDAAANALKEEELAQKQQELDQFDRVSKTTLVAAAVNIAGIVAILKHERFNVITTKAISFVGKMIK